MLKRLRLRHLMSPLGLEKKFICIFLLICGCSQAPSPKKMGGSIGLQSPLFSGSSSALITSPTQIYTLIGTCDSKALFTEWSYDGVNWAEVACVGGSFSLSLKLTPFVDVFARSKGSSSYSAVASARVKFVLPPTSDNFSLVASGAADRSDLVGVGTQNALGLSYAGGNFEASGIKIQTHLPRIIYER